MNLTPLQERRLQQAKDEIVLLEKQIRKKGFGFALWFSLLTVVIAGVVVYLFEWITDHKSPADFVKDYGWRSLLWNWIFWFLANCFL